MIFSLQCNLLQGNHWGCERQMAQSIPNPHRSLRPWQQRTLDPRQTVQSNLCCFLATHDRLLSFPHKSNIWFRRLRVVWRLKVFGLGVNFYCLRLDLKLQTNTLCERALCVLTTHKMTLITGLFLRADNDCGRYKKNQTGCKQSLVPLWKLVQGK